ncbi:MAG: UDP-galactopyranose mutase [candidate division WOR-3 bacterium]
MTSREDFDFIIVGAGLAGSVMAERIANVLNKKVLIIEQRNHIGGNCFDYKSKEGIIIHKYGPHIFHTDFDEVFRYLSNFTEWCTYEHRVLAYVDGKKIPVPFNFTSMEMLLSSDMAVRLKEKLISKFGEDSRVPIIRLLEDNDEDLKLLGDFIYKKIFLNYSLKQWGKKPEEIDQRVISRVPIVVGRDDRYFGDKYQAMPKEGYTIIFQRMLSNPNIKIMLNTNFKNILHVDKVSKRIYFLSEEFKGKLIYTARLDELFDYAFGVLPYRSLNFEVLNLDKPYFQEVAVVNYPNEFDYTRITEYKHLHPVETQCTTIVYEYPEEYTVGKIPYYPMFTREAQEKYSKYLELASNFENLILLGRLAEYKYYDMDDVVKRALEVFEEVCG